MKLIVFIFFAGQLYSSGALFLRKEAPLSCTTNEGEIGACVLHDQCDNDSTIIEDGTGIINLRGLESTDCPLSTVCCKIPDNHQKDSDHSGELHRNKPINSGERHRYKQITSRPETTNHPKTSYSVEHYRKQPKTLSCTTMDGTPGECVQNYQCDTDTNSVITNGDGIIDVRINESTDCPPPTVCCKIPDNRQKDSDPQTPNSEKNHRNQPKTSDQEAINYPQTLAQETTNHPITLSCTTMDGTPGECVQNYQCDFDTNSVFTHGDGVIDVRINESTDCPPPTVCCKIPDNRQKDFDPQTPNSEKNHRNQPTTSDQEAINYPQTLAQETTNHPITLSCTTMDGTPGECVQNYQCDFDISSVFTHGDGVIDVRINESTECPPPTVCCKIPDNRQKDSDPKTPKYSEENYRNQPKTSYQDTMNYPQTLALGTMNHPQTLTCTTMDGTPGKCVQNYQCDFDTDSAITNGDGVIDVRINESTDCPLPTVCCKIPNNNQEDPTHSKELDRKQQKTMDQETMNYPQRLDQETMNYSKRLNQETMNYPKKLDQETMNYPQRLDQETMNYPKRLDQETMNYPQRLDQETMNYPKRLPCTTTNGTPGECVQNYLCDVETRTRAEEKNSASTNACPIPMICCKVPDISSRSNLPSQSALYPYFRVPRDSNRSGCGHRNPGGVNVTGAALDTSPEYAKPGEFPWTVTIANMKGRVGRTAQFDYLGSGALIHERAVLTAAHIFHGQITPSTFYVVIGDYDQRAMNILPRKSIAVQNVEIHNQFEKDLLYDLALVFLQKPVLVSGHVNYICLPPPDYQDPVGTRCISSGWGKNGFNEHQYIMNKAEVPVVDHTACESLLRRIDNLGPLFELHSTFMCAGEGGVDSCKGSGGAPLACPMQVVIAAHCPLKLQVDVPISGSYLVGYTALYEWDGEPFIKQSTPVKAIFRTLDGHWKHLQKGPVWHLPKWMFAVATNDPDRYVLSGVVSWSINCSLDGIPSVYARVPTMRQWIDDKMAANGYPITT